MNERRERATSSDRTLRGITVLDLCMLGPGLYCTQVLQRLGARVIHFEPPSGDPARSIPGAHRALNAGKESVVADLKTAAGRDLLFSAARCAHVLVEGWRPGVADRLGVGPSAVLAANPAIVYCSLSGYGHRGTLHVRPGHDINYLAVSGLMRVLSDGREPNDFPLPLADIAGAFAALVRVLAALLQARASGEGAWIDVSIAGAAREWLIATGSVGASPPTRLLRSLPHYGVFETLDGAALTLGTTYEDHFWRELCRVLGREDWASLSLQERAAQASELRREIAKIVRSQTRERWEEALRDADTCWAFVEDPAEATDLTPTIPRAAECSAALGEHTESLKHELSSRELRRQCRARRSPSPS